MAVIAITIIKKAVIIRNCQIFGADMTRITKISTGVLAAIAGFSSVAYSAEKSEGFVEGSKFTVTSRTFYFNRDNRNGETAPGGRDILRRLLKHSLRNSILVTPKGRLVSD